MNDGGNPHHGGGRTSPYPPPNAAAYANPPAYNPPWPPHPQQQQHMHHPQHHPQQQQQQYYQPQQPPPPPQLSDPYGGGPPGLHGFTSQPPSRAPQPQLVRNVQARGGGGNNQHSQQQQRSQSPFLDGSGGTLSPSVGGWHGNAPAHHPPPPPPLAGPQHLHHADVKPSIGTNGGGGGQQTLGITPPDMRPGSAASNRAANRPRTADRRGAPAPAAGKAAGKAGSATAAKGGAGASDDDEADDGGSTGAGAAGAGGATVKKAGPNNGPSDFVKKLFKCVPPLRLLASAWLSPPFVRVGSLIRLPPSRLFAGCSETKSTPTSSRGAPARTRSSSRCGTPSRPPPRLIAQLADPLCPHPSARPLRT